MSRWELIALAYVSYLALVALLVPRFARARAPAITGAIASWVLWPLLPRRAPPAVLIVVPALVLLGGYWLSGTFFVRPMTAAEAWLRRWDDTLLVRSGLRAWYRRAPSAVHHAAELAYLLAYPMAPLGALTLTAAGSADRLAAYWTTVLLAGFLSYGLLPWIQTRPPRAVGAADPDLPATRLRRLNHLVLDRASVQVNTVPSGHAATALAVALFVVCVVPAAGAALLVLALLVAGATVFGGYHYAIDTILGALVAVGAWLLVAGPG